MNRLATLVLLSCCVIIYACTIILILSPSVRDSKKQTESNSSAIDHKYVVTVSTNMGPFELINKTQTIQQAQQPHNNYGISPIIVNSPYSLILEKDNQQYYFYDKQTKQLTALGFSSGEMHITPFNDEYSLITNPKNYPKYTFQKIDNKTGGITPFNQLKQICDGIYCGSPYGVGQINTGETLVLQAYGDACGSISTFSRYNSITKNHNKIITTKYLCGDGDQYLGTDGSLLYFNQTKSVETADADSFYNYKDEHVKYWAIDPLTKQKVDVLSLPENLQLVKYKNEIIDAKEYIEEEITDTPID